MSKVENQSLDSVKKKKRLTIAIIILLCVVYIFVAARPLSREIHFVPVWTIDADKSTRTDRIGDADKKTDDATASESDKKNITDLISFKMGQFAGYFTKTGKIISRVTFPYKASINSSYYSLYETHSEKIPIYSPLGEKLFEIKQTGFPHFSGNNILLMLPGGASFSKVGKDGELLWSYEGHAPITALSSSESKIIVGFADGELKAFDEEGKIDFEFSPAGSQYPIILGAGISNSGKLLATVSGQDQQRFILAKERNGSVSVVFHKYLEKALNEQVIVKFRKDEKAVYYSCAGGLGVLDCKNLIDSLIPIQGTILSIQEDFDGTIFVLSKNEKSYTVSVIEPFDIYSGSFSFEADSAFMTVREGSLFVGHDSKISRIDIKHK